MNKILITGGSGMVGRHLQNIMPDAIYLSSATNLVTGTFDHLLHWYQPDTVIHLAGMVGGVQSNLNQQYDYLYTNAMMGLNVVNACLKHNIENFVGILSTCIYPNLYPSYYDIGLKLRELMIHDGAPEPSNFGYAYGKRLLAAAVQTANKQFGKKYSCIIPSNLYGPYDKFDERAHFVAALIAKIHAAKATGQDSIRLLGDGTPLRQFLYAGDLAAIIKSYIDKDCRITMNIAPDEEYTVKEIAEIALKACDAEDLKIIFDPSLPNGQHRKTASNELLKQFCPEISFTSLYDGIKLTYDWYRNSLVKNG